jgi:hypothetical protein
MLESWKWQRPVKKNLFVIRRFTRSTCYRRKVSKDATSRFGSNENIFPVCQSFETFHLVDSKCFQIKFITNIKTGSGIFAYISSITCALCNTSSDWIRVLVAVTNEILKRKSSECILDPPRVEGRGTRIVTKCVIRANGPNTYISRLESKLNEIIMYVKTLLI